MNEVNENYRILMKRHKSPLRGLGRSLALYITLDSGGTEPEAVNSTSVVA
jgi:hypothetical protein